MFELFDILFRFVVMPILLFVCVVTIIGIAHDVIFGADWNPNINDILGYEDDGQGDIDDNEETIRM